MILFVAIAFTFIFFSIKWPDHMFWLAVIVFIDPGGYIFNYINRAMVGGLQLTDLTFILLLIPLLSPKVSLSSYFKRRDNRWIFWFLLSFSVFYHLFVFGLAAVNEVNYTILDVLQYQRLTLWGFFAVVPVYIFFSRNYMLFIKYAFFTSIILSLIYLTYLFTGFNVMPIWSSARGLGIEAQRISMYSYGFADWFIYASLIILLFRIKIQGKTFIYFIGLTLFIAIILSLTRRSILLLFFSVFVIYFLHQKLLKMSFFSSKLLNIFLVAVVAFFVLYLTFPGYIKYTYAMVENSISFLNPNINDPELADDRIENDIPKHFERFWKAPVFGYGYDVLWYSNKSEEGGLSANDVPLTAALGMFGIIGISIFSIYYLKIISILFKLFNILKQIIKRNKIEENKHLFIISVTIISIYISLFTINIFSLFQDLIVGKERVIQMFVLGFMLASRDLLINQFKPIN